MPQDQQWYLRVLYTVKCGTEFDTKSRTTSMLLSLGGKMHNSGVGRRIYKVLKSLISVVQCGSLYLKWDNSSYTLF
jgi:hypothetical protein